ncbi:MAG TPA: hypothetical protein VNL18_07240 [Gemmatimonadales bacterium]|nr:hypothetical protein [Gemmatimonadales bacterium]
MRHRWSVTTAVFVAAAWACGGGEQAGQDETARDLSLAPAESVATLSDQPATEPQTTPSQPPAPRPQPQTQPQTRPRTEPAQPPARPAPLSLEEGTTVELWAADTLTSRHNKVGEAVTATAGAPVRDSRGREVIPAGAVFLGTISDIAPAETPGGQGRMVLTFNRVQFGGKTYAVQARTDSLGTYMKGRGVTAGDAAKVGAGAVVGGIAGRIIGGNKTGTAVGAAAGAAAGVGIAAATRDVDIILPAGGLVRIVLTAPFTMQEVTS